LLKVKFTLLMEIYHHPAGNCVAPCGGFELLIPIQYHGLTPVAGKKFRPLRGLLIPVPHSSIICSPRSGRYILSHGRKPVDDNEQINQFKPPQGAARNEPILLGNPD